MGDLFREFDRLGCPLWSSNILYEIRAPKLFSFNILSWLRKRYNYFMNFQEWAAVWGMQSSPEHIEEVRQWSEKGIRPESFDEFFSGQTLVKVEEVDNCVSQKIGGRVNYLLTSIVEPSYWVLKLKDGSFYLVSGVYALDDKEKIYKSYLVECARGGSLEECLERADPDEKPEVYETLLRAGRMHGLKL